MLHYYRLHLQVVTHHSGIMLSKSYIFITHVDPISPPNPNSFRVIGGGAGYRPRVRNVYSIHQFIAVVGYPTPYI